MLTIRNHPQHHMTGLHELKNADHAFPAVVIRRDGSADVYGPVAVIDQRRADDTEPAAEVPSSPLEMARNAVASVRRRVEYVVEGDTDPEKALLAHVHQVGAAADQDSKVAARMAVVSIAEDLHQLAGYFTGGERIRQEFGALICLCGNDLTQEGFAPCLDDGTEVEPLADGPWGGVLYVCGRCGRIVDQYTLRVTGRAPAPERVALAAIIRLLDGPGTIAEKMSGARALAAETLRQVQ
jgi:hypothetical protein